MRRLPARLAALAAAALLSPALAHGRCALCRVAANEGSDGFLRGLYAAILLGTAVPTILLGTFAWKLYRGPKPKR